MKIKIRSAQKYGIIVEIMGNMIARDSEDLKEYLFDSLDKGKITHLINCKHVRKIDGLGINTICYFINRGMHISLFNVHAEVRGMLKLSGKEGFINIIKESEIGKYISLLENEILEKKDSKIDSKKRRVHTRINTSFPTKFKHYNESNEIVKITANILNLSGGGMQVDQIVISNTKAGKYGEEPYIKGFDLQGIKFELNGNSEIVETNGECVWESNSFNDLSAGIRFKGISNESKSRILKYVNKTV